MTKRIAPFLLPLVAAIPCLGISTCSRDYVPNLAGHASKARADHKSLAEAIERYYVDHNVYPPSTTSVEESVYADARPVGSIPAPNPLGNPLPFPTFQRDTPFSSGTAYLPDGALTWNHTDPFSPMRRNPYGYFSSGQGWVLASLGPDGDFDLRPQDYDVSIPQPSPGMLSLSYDPTNGYRSSGDIIRVKH
jgi:hypothetical protein